MFFSSYGVLSLVLWGMALFVVAPHLELISKPAARTVRLGSFAQLAQVPLPFVFMFARMELPLLELVSPLLTAVFFGSLALAAKQVVDGAPPKRELR